MVEAHGRSERGACQLVGANRASIRYESHKLEEGLLREKITSIAHEKRRYGYRRIHLLIRREGLKINPRTYLEDIMRRLMTHPANKLEELLPDRWLTHKTPPA